MRIRSESWCLLCKEHINHVLFTSKNIIHAAAILNYQYFISTVRNIKISVEMYGLKLENKREYYLSIKKNIF